MPVKEFTDAAGRRWRAWDVMPESIHPATKSEDYLHDCYITGWIAFETVSGDQKRRLCPWPADWLSGGDEYLRELLAMAEVVPPSRAPTQRRSIGNVPGVPAAAEPVRTSDELDTAERHVVRTFRYPGGRYWAACVVTMPEDGGPPVLRFTSGMRSIDLRRWPKDWADQPEHALVTMLRHAAPRPAAAHPGAGVPRRRWDDQPTA